MPTSDDHAPSRSILNRPGWISSGINRVIASKTVSFSLTTVGSGNGSIGAHSVNGWLHDRNAHPRLDSTRQTARQLSCQDRHADTTDHEQPPNVMERVECSRRSQAGCERH